ncbi:hypothetical protein RKE30_12400 [Streptomyces sp. Li-HN-5-11]|uniref:hypothetical protein n=1 Tax=Streptomyces sp. Li-HN-5-11 TaxID=3075432 RepID=UPI0028AFA3B4|nr:hypothetical protein [Streptomyces sp. Li-HN-5-11]WNM31160.1 hypothetical protein RKE30_12400 [Streptomyces sp. Li-HN-5-11]
MTTSGPDKITTDGAPPAAPDPLGWTDCALLDHAGIPCLLFGVDGEGAHAATEYVDLAQCCDRKGSPARDARHDTSPRCRITRVHPVRGRCSRLAMLPHSLNGVGGAPSTGRREPSGKPFRPQHWLDRLTGILTATVAGFCS